MSKQLVIPQKKLDAIEKLIAQGDLAPMTQEQRLGYMRTMCKLLGISMLGQPFDFIKLNGKLQMYANAKCAAQLRATYGVSLTIAGAERIDGLYVVSVEGVNKKGRKDADIGAINIKGLSGENLQNAMMKATTKAKRRVTLSLCGLGSLDADTAKEMAERDAQAATAMAIEETGGKLDQTKSRPEFESERHVEETKQPESESIQTPAAEPVKDASQSTVDPTGGNYRMKVGKNTGKLVKDLPTKKLQDWVKWYAKMKEGGKDLHPDVELEVVHITQYLDELKLEEESKKEKKS